ncbi:MAG: DUF4870 domain-containing protein [Candidatus Sericytochromatia bacterium]|nr:DUF4870 domain-containing protein [Candidatus Sericytochromatia bacterium]
MTDEPSSAPLTTHVPGVLLPPAGWERLAAAAAHASPVYAPLLGPVVIWLLGGSLGGSPFVGRQALQALLFHLLATVVLTPLWGATYALWALILIGWPFAIVMTVVSGVASLWFLWHCLRATLAAFGGRGYRLPIVGVIER